MSRRRGTLLDQQPCTIARVLASGDRDYKVVGLDASFVMREAARVRDWFVLQARGKKVW